METLLECCQQPDHETLKTVMDGAKTWHDPALTSQKRQRKRQLPVG